MENNIKMIKTDAGTIELLSKIKGWHLIRGNNISYTDIVKKLVYNDGFEKELLDDGGNKNYQKKDERKGL